MSALRKEATQWQPGVSGNPGGKRKPRIKRIEEILAFEGLHPVTEIIRLINEGNLHDRDKLKAWCDLLSYVQAKPRPIDEAKDDDEELEGMSTPDLLKLVNEKMPGALAMPIAEEPKA